jgi:hypothetical protein
MCISECIAKNECNIVSSQAAIVICMSGRNVDTSSVMQLNLLGIIKESTQCYYKPKMDFDNSSDNQGFFSVKFCAVATGNHRQEESANLATGQVEIYCLNMAISGKRKSSKSSGQ